MAVDSDFYRNPRGQIFTPRMTVTFKHSVVGDVKLDVYSRKGKTYMRVVGQKGFEVFKGALMVVNGYVVCRIREVNGTSVMLTSCDVAYPPKMLETAVA